MTYDDEIDGIVNSIDRSINKKSKIQTVSYVGIILSLILMFYLSRNYPSPPYPPYPAFAGILLIIFLFLNIYGNDYTVFKNMKEKIFYYLFCSWKYHNDEKSKTLLKECIDELETHLDEYEELAYTEDIYSTFNLLRDTLIYHIYPKMGIRGIGKETDLPKQTIAWDEFKLLATDVYQNFPLSLINERINRLKSSFERDEKVKLDEENKLIKSVKNIICWNGEKYKNSLFYRFIFFLILTIIIDYFLIKNNMVTNEIIIPATILIPIMAPYYLASRQK